MIQLCSLGGNLIERLRICVSMDKTLADRHSADVKKLCRYEHPLVLEGDVLHLSYDLDIGYFGQVSANLAAFSRILDDPEAVRAVTTNELLHGQCLIQDIVNKIKSLQEKIEAAKPKRQFLLLTTDFTSYLFNVESQRISSPSLFNNEWLELTEKLNTLMRTGDRVSFHVYQGNFVTAPITKVEWV